ncbi:hypothetical protein PFISCL1PPCAC_13567 [Pristionchus fissidentatus]|uniref:N-acetylgalactosaminide beta-1,3-galactosyltransferase n=1 Tax=Pristionchus fissidentatus TaxID=1538716 RepID=A0AAV5VUQ8_9BILA|nr:hypothetical protein PFISCL1PPCAC_13567 [Pristionchus fissidentatus]
MLPGKMIPPNRANSSGRCSKEVKFCGLFCIIIILQMMYLHWALRRSIVSSGHHYNPSEEVYLPHASFDQIASDIEISDAAQLLPTNGTLFCFVFTAPKYHRTRVPAVASTWLSRCDHGQFFSSKPIDDYGVFSDIFLSKESKNAQVVLHHDIQQAAVPYSTVFKTIPDDYELLFSKTLLALRYTYRTYPDFDWYYKADDDTFVIVEHLRRYLDKLDPSKPHYIGYRLNKHIPRGYHSGGAGYVLSRAAMDAFDKADLYSDRKKCPPCKYEDVGIGRCLASLNIHPKNARNAKGQTLFNPNRPDQVIQSNGSDSVAADSISFHHLSPQQILNLQLFTYSIERPTK